MERHSIPEETVEVEISFCDGCIPGTFYNILEVEADRMAFYSWVEREVCHFMTLNPAKSPALRLRQHVHIM